MKRTPHAEAEASLLRLHTEQLHDDADEDEDEDDEFGGRSRSEYGLRRRRRCRRRIIVGRGLTAFRLGEPTLHVLGARPSGPRKLPQGTDPPRPACVGTGEGAEDAEGGSATSACCCCCCCCCRFMAERLVAVLQERCCLHHRPCW